MYIPGQNEPPPRKIYEVGVLTDEADQQLVLTGLAKTFGWDIKELATPDLTSSAEERSGEFVTLRGLRAASLDLFGAERYGATAHTMIENWRERYTLYPSFSRGHEGYIYNAGFGGATTVIDCRINSKGKSQTEINHEILTRAAATVPPFEFEFGAVNTRNGVKQNALIPCPDVRTDLLAKFLVHNRYTHHELNGLLGKSFDVLNNVTGTAEPLAAEPYNPDEFIIFREFVAWAKTTDVTASMILKTKQTIERAIDDQFATGKTGNKTGGEVVIEEYCNLSPEDQSLSGNEAVAITSLGNMGKAMHSPKTAPFLMRVPELLRSR